MFPSRHFRAFFVEVEAGDGGGVRGDEFAVDAGADALFLDGRDAAPPRIDAADVAAELEHFVHAGFLLRVARFELLDDFESAEGDDGDADADTRRDEKLRAGEEREYGGCAAFHGEECAGCHFRCDVADFREC